MKHSVYDPGYKPEEARFIRALNDNPEDDTTRAAYADWLEERGDPRAEVLRLSLRLAKGIAGAEELAALEGRLRALATRNNYIWFWIVTTRASVLNCGAAPHKHPLVRFDFECPKKWETLRTTGDKAVRFCDQCNNHVFFCATKEEAQRRALQGDCIAIGLSLGAKIQQDHPLGAVGRPSPYLEWKYDLFEGRDYVPAENVAPLPPPPAVTVENVAPLPVPALEEPPPTPRWWQFWKWGSR